MAPMDSVGHQTDMAGLAGMAHLVVGTVVDPVVLVVLVALVVRVVLVGSEGRRTARRLGPVDQGRAVSSRLRAREDKDKEEEVGWRGTARSRWR